MGKMQNMVCMTCTYYIELLLIFASVVTGCVSIFAFVSLVSISSGIAIFTVGLKLFAITM